jgi:hypothetical protein
MSISFVFSGTVGDSDLTVVLDDGPLHIRSDHHNYSTIKDALRDGDDVELVRLFNAPEQNAQRFQFHSMGLTNAVAQVNEAVLNDDVVYLNGEAVNDVIAQKIVETADQGLPYEGILRFLENIENNPSSSSRAELYEFLANKGLPITEDGHFLAYKAVRNDFKDKYQGKFDNSPGMICEMPRNKVDDNRGNHCSKGLHAGALDYVAQYGGGTDRIIEVKIDPCDVVSVPSDCSFQ